MGQGEGLNYKYLCLTVLEVGRLKVKVLADAVSDESSLRGL